MTNPSSNTNHPNASDAILGGNTPAPLTSGILGGLDGIRQKLESGNLPLQLEALTQALTYGDAGQTCLKNATKHPSKTVRNRALWLLRGNAGKPISDRIPNAWNLTERFTANGNTTHVTQFANREVRDFDPKHPPDISPKIAYALRCGWDNETNGVELLEQLLEISNSDQIEALVIGLWDGDGDICTGDSNAKTIVDAIAEKCDHLPNLKALFIGDITYEECEISWLVQSDMSPLLTAYPQLEMLQVRGGIGLKFEQPAEQPAKHEHLNALIIETGGLSRETVQQIYAWDLPALEHLELWFGSENYGGDCWEQDLAPVLEDLCFPSLTYLGLRNSKFANEMIDRVITSPILQGLQVLDLSLGTLADEGAAKLLTSKAIQALETLNVSHSYLSGTMIDQLKTLKLSLLADEQREEDDYEDDPAYRRYCAIAE